jgi:hypothetical protein
MGDIHMVAQDLLQGKDGELHSQSDIQVLTETESTQVIWMYDMPDILVVLHHAHDGSGRENDMQTRILIVAMSEVLRPIRAFEDLVNEQGMTTCLYKLTRKLQEGVLGKIEIVEIDIERALTKLWVLLTKFLRIIEQEVGLTYSTATLDSNQSVVPIDLIHQYTTDGNMHVLHQVIVCLVKCL